MSEKKLEPCPFCGGSAEFLVDIIGPGEVRCVDCDAMVRGDTKITAPNAWNRRTPPLSPWREAIEAAAKVAEKYALDQESCERPQAETICYVIRDAIRSLSPPAASPWRDISSAPKDGTDILWCTDRGEYMRKRHLYEVIRWPTYKECFEEGFWQPLPSPPAGDVSRALLAASDLPPPPDVLGDPLGHGSSQGGKR